MPFNSGRRMSNLSVPESAAMYATFSSDRNRTVSCCCDLSFYKKSPLLIARDMRDGMDPGLISEAIVPVLLTTEANEELVQPLPTAGMFLVPCQELSLLLTLPLRVLGSSAAPRRIDNAGI